jgi:hypothetical protein
MKNDVFIMFSVGDFYREFIVAVSEFKYLYFEVWVGCEGWLICRWGS